MKIVIVGPVPPPIGGVSIHIQRLSQMLINAGDKVTFIDESPIKKANFFYLRSLMLIPYLRLIKSGDIIHIHSSVSVFRILHLIICLLLKKKIVLTLHSWREKSKLLILIQRWLFQKSQTVICVNDLIYREVNLNNAIVQPAFIPPDISVEPELPIHVEQWLTKKKDENRIIIASNAYRLDLFNSVDLYGLDMAIELIDFLIHEKKINVALIFVVTTLKHDEKLFYSNKQKIADKKLTENIFLIHEKELSYVKLIQKTDLSCRLTNTDGDALSIREALFLNKPIVASDSANRPSGTITFKARDQIDLNKTVYSLLLKIRDYSPSNYANDINHKVYKSIYSTSMEKI